MLVLSSPPFFNPQSFPSKLLITPREVLSVSEQITSIICPNSERPSKTNGLIQAYRRKDMDTPMTSDPLGPDSSPRPPRTAHHPDPANQEQNDGEPNINLLKAWSVACAQFSDFLGVWHVMQPSPCRQWEMLCGGTKFFSSAWCGAKGSRRMRLSLNW